MDETLFVFLKSLFEIRKLKKTLEPLLGHEGRPAGKYSNSGKARRAGGVFIV
jgi:hypothetical protein